MSRTEKAVVRSSRALAVVSMLLAAAGAQAGERIAWRTGAVDTTRRSPAAIAEVLEGVAATPGSRHLVVQFNGPIGPAEKTSLSSAGLELLSYLGDHAFFAAVRATGVDPDAVAGTESLIDAKPIERRWKLHPLLAAREVPGWAVVSPPESEGEGGPVIVGAYVLFHRDVALSPRGVNTARKHEAVVRSLLESINGLVIELPLDNIPALADEDAVQWIEPPLPRMSEMNNSNRTRVGADIVQAPPYDLDGSGVTVLVYDGGYALSSHQDYGGRLTVRDSSGLSDHATHVSCTVGGSGVASGGTYKGMAPGVTIESYGFDYDGSGIFLYSNPGDIEDDYDEAINTYGADLSNNSIGTNTCWNGFPCDITGNYGVTSVLIDSIVRGSLGPPFRVVWANGNERSCTYCPGEHTPEGYHSTAPPACAKNHITVGALNSNDDSQTDFTSWGPADDGRMKPDIAAPGCQSNDDYDVTSCSSYGSSSYTGKCGTSMASPTVAGMSALLLQDFRAQFPDKPDFRNSTLKMLLAHNAVDLAPLGPDYKAGYGSVRIQPAVDFMRSENFLEQKVTQGEVYSALAVVSPGDPEIKITLAWDDVPGTPNVDPALVNDLDLVVYDPSGLQHFPWTLDPANPSQAAVRTQADHVNNIEQVYVEDPAAGAWQVEVHGFNVPQGPQEFSLGVSPMFVNCSTIGVISLDAVRYPCASNAQIEVVDCDLNIDGELVETVEVTIASDSEPAGETVLLTETAAGTAQFLGSIPLETTDAAGVLQIIDGDTVTASYIDADDGFGGLNVLVEDTAVVDCQPPIVSLVQVSEIEPRSATISFSVDEPATGTIRYGHSCAALTETATGYGYKTSHTILLTGLEDGTAYSFAVDVTDQAGNTGTDDNGGDCYDFATPDIPDFFTEDFGSDNDLENLSLSFTPDGSDDSYWACVEAITELPTDPAGGTALSWTPNDDDGYAAVTLSGGATVSLYDSSYSTFYVGTNGFITFGGGDDDYDETLAEHFALPRISALYDDLNANYGAVTWRQLANRAVVTWEDVPEFSNTGSNTFQIEMYSDGTIVISYLSISAADGIAGLSAGEGLSPDFLETDLTEAGPCVVFGDCDSDGDTDADDLDVFISCFSGEHGGTGPECRCVDFDLDNDVDCRDWSALLSLWTEPGDPPLFGPCEHLTVAAEGGRYLAVAPSAAPGPVALFLTGDFADPTVSCLARYVQEDGSLGEAPIFRAPSGPEGWNTVHVHGQEIIPDAMYWAQGDYGVPGEPLLSPAEPAITWRWGDVDFNGVVNFTDVHYLVFGFMGDFTHASFEALNLAPCALDEVINMTDIQWAIMSFKGNDYWETGCTPPCS